MKSANATLEELAAAGIFAIPRRPVTEAMITDQVWTANEELIGIRRL